MISVEPIIIGITVTAVLYYTIGLSSIKDCYSNWFKRKYWTSYNIVEAVSWFSKAIIIIPGLVFKVEVTVFYFITLITSISLIWASNKKLLPTLVAFNTLWIFLSLIILWREYM